MILTEESRRTRRKPCPSASLSTTIFTRTDLEENPGLRDEKPAPNLLLCDATLKVIIVTKVTSLTMVTKVIWGFPTQSLLSAYGSSCKVSVIFVRC
jgi:hypothetical protein